jgi:ubiquinone/menaquinone biosynthesis C-methylase UbiE
VKRRSFEYVLENNRLRSFVRDLMEVKPLRAATDVGRIRHALHIACGGGDPTRLILKYFSAEKVSGIDRDAEVIEAARGRRWSVPVDFSVQDVRSMSFADGSFDAAFNLADLHNWPDWRRGVRELWRVLEPGGLLISEELSRETFAHAAGRMFKALTDHPYDDMLTVDEFCDHVRRTGFEILDFEKKCPFGLLEYFIVVARKT